MSKSVDKAITVLNCFSLEHLILGVGEISGLTGYTKSTVSRLLTTLYRHGCVERAGGHGKYQLGYRISLWARMSDQQNNLVNIARPVMERLRDICGEEIALYVVEGDRRVCVARVQSVHEIAKVGPVGSYYPLHAGASGKVLLAYLPADKRNVIIHKGCLEKYTSFTITDTKKLEKDLQNIRRKGYSVSKGEREPDAFSVTAPVWDASGRVVASLSISGPNFRLTDKQLKQNIREISAASKEISKKLGYPCN
ncbi:MAG: IclR family transcriptional regulator [Desulfobacterales bacterium]|nr:MAG: IclR family transcriptional regulator [Desulfobacterales bacterium]